MVTLPTNPPLIVARRGASAQAPENTLPAFDLAVAQGADAIEMDVQFTSDGALILMHGLTVDDVSDGSGRIRSHTLDEIRELDAGSWFGPQYRGIHVPTLQEALDALAGRVLLILELKSFTPKSEEMEDLVWAEIAQRGLADQVIVTSFNPFLLRRLKKMAPDCRTGLMQATGMAPWYRGAMARRWAQADDWHPEYDLAAQMNPERVGLPLWLWPVQNEAQVLQAQAWGATALITDDPGWLRSYLETDRGKW